MGYVVSDVYVDGEYVRSTYKSGIILVAAPLFLIALRNFYVFGKMHKHSDDPVLRNQVLVFILAVSILLFFAIMSLPAWLDHFPLAHYGNLLVAFILSYAVVRHKLVDIKIVLRKGTAWVTLMAFGVACFWLLLILFHGILQFEIDFVASLVATLVALAVSAMIYIVRVPFFEFINRTFQGSS